MKNASLPEETSQSAATIQEAIIFLVTRMQESGHNPKPVIFHSIHVGTILFDHNYTVDVVKAGILHDIIEDSMTPISEIVEKFGEKVAALVQANTFDTSVETRAAQGKDCIERCLKYGKDALVIRIADRLENIIFFNPALKDEFAKFWVSETRSLVEVSQPMMHDELLWHEIDQKCRKLEHALQIFPGKDE